MFICFEHQWGEEYRRSHRGSSYAHCLLCSTYEYSYHSCKWYKYAYRFYFSPADINGSKNFAVFIIWFIYEAFSYFDIFLQTNILEKLSPFRCQLFFPLKWYCLFFISFVNEVLIISGHHEFDDLDFPVIVEDNLTHWPYKIASDRGEFTSCFNVIFVLR